jgi:hypothetical protein
MAGLKCEACGRPLPGESDQMVLCLTCYNAFVVFLMSKGEIALTEELVNANEQFLDVEIRINHGNKDIC